VVTVRAVHPSPSKGMEMQTMRAANLFAHQRDGVMKIAVRP
jgi:hypothetical protein